MISEEERSRKFCESSWKPIAREDARVMIFGLPYEGEVNSRPGAAQGPDAIRRASDCIESYSPFFNRDLLDVPFYDDGNIRIKGGGKLALEAMAGAIWKRLRKELRPVFLGGDHSVTYSVVKALLNKGHKFSIVHLDAHADFQDEFEGSPWCYATAMRRTKEILKGEIYQLGIRTGTKAELEEASSQNKLFLCDRFLEGLSYVEKHLKGKDVYISFDIDALDPSLAPGTSNPAYGGLQSDHVRLLLHTLKGVNVIGFDVVEVAPNLDPSGLTAIIASEIVRDGILAWWG